MPADLFALAGQAQAGVPIVTHDPASVDDLMVIMRVDTHSPDYSRITYGAFCPGVPDPNGGAALYTNFTLIDSPVFPSDPKYILRIWQFLPGTELVKISFEKETNAVIRTYTQKVSAGTSVRPITFDAGSKYNGDFVIDGDYIPLSEGAGTLVTVTIEQPATRIEDKSVGFQFPALFEFLGAWNTPPVCVHQGPYAGVNYTLSAHRTASKPGELTTSYVLNRPSVSNTYGVTTPGVADRFFGIGQNTIHNAIYLEDTCGAGSQIVEDLPASDPNSYDPTDALLIETDARRWLGNLYKKTELTLTETP